MLKTRHLKKILHRLFPTFVSILLLVGIGYIVIGKIHGASIADPLHHEEGGTAKAQAEARGKDRPSPTIKIAHPIQNIAEMHLFGEAPQEALKPDTPPVTVAVETTSNLLLHGIIKASGATGESLAIIADAKGKQDSYAVGSILSEGIVLMEVNDDHVVLNNNNRLETLHMWNVSRNKSRESAAEEFLPTSVTSDSTMYGMPPENGRDYPRNYRKSRPLRQFPPPGHPSVGGKDR